MRIITITSKVLVEPVRLLPPDEQRGFLYIPATAVEPDPHIGRLACHNQELFEREGLSEGDLVVFGLNETHFEMPFQGAVLLVVDVAHLSGKVELDEGWRVIPMRDPLPQEFAPAFKGPKPERGRGARGAAHARADVPTSPATPRALGLDQALGLAEQTNPEQPAPIRVTDLSDALFFDRGIPAAADEGDGTP